MLQCLVCWSTCCWRSNLGHSRKLATLSRRRGFEVCADGAPQPTRRGSRMSCFSPIPFTKTIYHSSHVTGYKMRSTDWNNRVGSGSPWGEFHLIRASLPVGGNAEGPMRYPQAYAYLACWNISLYFFMRKRLYLQPSDRMNTVNLKVEISTCCVPPEVIQPSTLWRPLT